MKLLQWCPIGLLVIFGSLFGCSGYHEGPNPVRARTSVHGENVICNQTVVQSTKQQDGSMKSTTTQSQNQMFRKMHDEKDAVVTDATGEVTFTTTDSPSGPPLVQGDYTYVMHRELRTTTLADRSVHESSHTLTTMTGKNGYQFTKDKGQPPVNTLSVDQTDETISVMEAGGLRRRISAKHNGHDVPNADYVTETKTANGVVTEHTRLRSPAPSPDGTAGETIESDDMTCVTGPVKHSPPSKP